MVGSGAQTTLGRAARSRRSGSQRVESVSQLDQPESHPALDGAGWQVKPARDFLVRQAVEEAEPDDLLLRVRQAREQSRKLLRFGTRGEVAGHIVSGGLLLQPLRLARPSPTLRRAR